jgi:hypothetical protein
MATLWESYTNQRQADRAAQVLIAAGVPGRDIRLLTACPLRDLRAEPRGGFAGAVDPDALHGTYAGDRRSRRNGAGSFASVAHRGGGVRSPTRTAIC